ncbi:TadE/TadG family type IV pilus assembly protein [Pseudomonas alkylphenolica]|uniref:TadE/TadG family type IV pilus assembly protein n=1 Tax=Pseudomonas alkylphenolica TaxID=237609 RepID=UPI0018D6EEC5|nr:TadE/TadG family type IV pilus assembly protein [Pseudomonas alkylphenolica]MBH3427515.1 pilus assembly protein [Pseudomonas alkylphenolica]
MKAGSVKQQKGAVALEFAAVFVIFFAVFYGVVSYGLPMLMLQSFNQASSEAVRRCVALDPSSKTYRNDVDTLAKGVLGEQLAWMPKSLNFQLASDASVTLTAGNLLTVKIDYAKEKLSAVLPVLILPGIGEVPRLPTHLTAAASLQL